jgi:hypothetical protein
LPSAPDLRVDNHSLFPLSKATCIIGNHQIHSIGFLKGVELRGLTRVTKLLPGSMDTPTSISTTVYD